MVKAHKKTATWENTDGGVEQGSFMDMFEEENQESDKPNYTRHMAHNIIRWK
jgi:hypothetical protein